MNETLQKELSAHFKKISDRKEQLDKIEEALNLKDNSLKVFEEEIEAELTKRFKEYLDKKNFDYEKGRNNQGSRIIFENGNLKIRQFKSHHFYEVNVLTSDKLNEFLPSGLIEARKIINEKLNKIKGIILEFKEKKRLKKGINIQSIDNNKIKTNKIKEIEIGFNCEEEHTSSSRNRYTYSYDTQTYKVRNEKFEIKLNGYSYDVDEALYSDEVFNNILLLIDKFKIHIKKIEDVKEEMKTDLRNFIRTQIDKMIILEALKDEN